MEQLKWGRCAYHKNSKGADGASSREGTFSLFSFLKRCGHVQISSRVTQKIFGIRDPCDSGLQSKSVGRRCAASREPLGSWPATTFHIYGEGEPPEGWWKGAGRKEFTIEGGWGLHYQTSRTSLLQATEALLNQPPPPLYQAFTPTVGYFSPARLRGRLSCHGF